MLETLLAYRLKQQWVIDPFLHQVSTQTTFYSCVCRDGIVKIIVVDFLGISMTHTDRL